MMTILIPILTLAALGLIFGMGLAIASKKFAVQTDPRLEQITALLPNVNCGACGKPGCSGFAEELLAGTANIDACKSADLSVKEKIAAILGKKVEQKEKLSAVLLCNGGSKVKNRFLYYGLEDCTSANLVLGGQKECIYGCLGYGNCVKVCPFGAITMSKPDHLPVVNQEKCRACNKCVEACPKKLFVLLPPAAKVYLACSSRDSGRDTKSFCPVGCIACKSCERACKFDAIHVVDNLAVIDYKKCTSCYSCVKVCPVKVIKTRLPIR
jgi:Na+-translocating ferredoxin:NAD+ oxidoreductase RNF subunit RnfB